MPEEESTPLWKLVLEQFEDQLVIILLGAAGVSFLLAMFDEGSESFVEPFVILLILIVNAIVGVVQESNAEKAIEALKSYAPDEAKVLRDGHLSKIPAVLVVPGDIVEVAVGDKIPADLRVLEIQSSVFRVDQAILTGESVSVSKISAPIEDTECVKQDQLNILFSGTTVTVGKCRAIAVKTGLNTAIGEIQLDITSQTSEKTPLKKKLDDFGDSLAKVITVICILVWLINIRHFNDPSHGGILRGAIYYFKIAVALAVAAIPEGLAVVITTCLALGTKKMAKKNAIVRSLPSVETLGCTSVICSDKTGTLTTNQMTVCKIALVRDAKGKLEEFEVEGHGYDPHGQVKSNGTALKSVSGNGLLTELAQVCALCNDSTIGVSEAGVCYSVGEPTESALKVLVEKLKTDNEKFNHTLDSLSLYDRAEACNGYYEKQFSKLATLDFDRDRKSMSVYCKSETTKKCFLFAKGAPENILERCTYVKSSDGQVSKISPEIRNNLLTTLSNYGKKDALRVLACAVNESPKEFSSYDFSDPRNYLEYESGMTFLGLVAMQDPPRSEVLESIRKCHNAGIRVIVITGDNKNTAEAVCRKIGIFHEDEDLRGKSLTGHEFDSLTVREQYDAVLTANLFSRTEPVHKSKLVSILQESGYVVAMTGDGVNDAPALKRADIGIAMGSGTDVAKLASDMVLADDNFASIVAAVEEGRSIYNNTKQFIRYLISSNIGEVVSIFLTVLLGMPEALIPVQLLWVNLVTDGLPATALGFNPPDHSIMRQPPRSKNEPLVDTWLFIRYCVIGLYVGAATVFGYAWWFMYYVGGPQITFSQLSNFHTCSTAFPEIGCEMFTNWMSHRATTMSLSILVVIEMLNAMNSLSENESLLWMPLWENMYLVFAITLSMILHFVILYVPFFTEIFSITSLGLEEWKWVLIISLPVLFIDEGLKFVTRTFIKPDKFVVHKK